MSHHVLWIALTEQAQQMEDASTHCGKGEGRGGEEGRGWTKRCLHRRSGKGVFLYTNTHHIYIYIHPRQLIFLWKSD